MHDMIHRKSQFMGDDVVADHFSALRLSLLQVTLEIALDVRIAAHRRDGSLGKGGLQVWIALLRSPSPA